MYFKKTKMLSKFGSVAEHNEAHMKQDITEKVVLFVGGFRAKQCVRCCAFAFWHEMLNVGVYGGSVAEWLAHCVCTLWHTVCHTVAHRHTVFAQCACAKVCLCLCVKRHTVFASVHQAAKLIAALCRVARVTAGLAESNGSLPPGL